MTGIPLGIKDLFCTEGVASQAAQPDPRRLQARPTNRPSPPICGDAGAVMLGKLNMDEFAMGSSNETSPFTAVRSTRGGAQGGQPQAGARRLVGRLGGGRGGAICASAATGTDTGGSIRQPAAFTGIVGIKPTYGRCSRWGIVAFASSLDQAGPMTTLGARRGDHAAARWPATTPRIRPRVDVAGARLRGGADRRHQGHDDRHPDGVPHRRHAGRDRGALADRASTG